MDWFKDYGVTAYGYVEDSKPLSVDYFTEWIHQKKNGPLSYLEGERFTKRLDIKNHWPDFESSLVFLFSYHDTHQYLQEFYQKKSDWNGLKLGSFTLGFEGLDYHDILKNKLNQIGNRLKKEFDLDFKITLDTHPVLERDLAYKAGLGWFGKNSMLINKEEGSFVIIGSLLLNKKIGLEINSIDNDHCGQCTLCIDQCPTKAIDPITRTIIAEDCISTYTIEQFKLDTIPSKNMDLKSGFIFGCDICQDVCPWNKRIDRIKKDSLFEALQPEPLEKITNFFLSQPIEKIQNELEKMSNKDFIKKFQGTSFERSGKRGLLKNLKLYLKQKSANF